MNSVIYAEFESILVPYSTCDKEDVTTKYLNKHVTCGYSLNVVTDHDKQTKKNSLQRRQCSCNILQRSAW